MTVGIRDSTVMLRPACEADAQAIYDIKKEAFGVTYLPFTIYRSPKAIAHLRQSIAYQDGSYIVAECGGDLTGYASISYSECQPILTYIAVSSAARGGGVGIRLLEATESALYQRGFTSLSLDVFESNARAVQWYTRSGYSNTSQRSLYRIALTGPMDVHCLLPSRRSLWEQALAAEAQYGFSKVTERIAAGEITLGLIGGVAGKLLDYEGLGLEEAIEAVLRMLNGSRSELIVVSREPLTSVYRALSHELSLRMVKSL